MNHLSDTEIQDYLDSNIPGEKTGIHAHLDSCTLCRDKLRQYELLYTGLNADRIPTLRPDFAASVAAAIKDELVVSSRSVIWIILTSVLGIAGIIACSIYFVNFTRLLSVFRKLSFRNYFEFSFISEYKEHLYSAGIDVNLVVFVALGLIAIGIIDYLVRRHREKPVSFLV